MMYLASLLFCAFLGIGSAQLPASQLDPCDHTQGVVADDTYCDRYWECVTNEPHLYDCPNGLVFVGKNRGIAEGCDYPWRGSYCFSRVNGVIKEKPRANTPISTEHCDWLYGIFGHETSCTRYWTCWNGTSTEQFCIGGLLYNEETHACDWPQNVQGCQKHPLCKDDPNANVPLGQSCERYWACQGGYPRLQRCPATLVFDKISRRCLSPPTEDCEAPPPPVIEEQETQFRTGGGPARRNNIGQTRRQGSSAPIRPVEQPIEEEFVEEQLPNESFQPREQNFQPREQNVQPREQNFQLREQNVQQPREQQTVPKPRVRRPISISDLPAGAIPAGAIPIQFKSGQLRPAPIDDAIPLN